VSYLVSQRTQEIGVRLALGASARDVLGMLMRDAMRPVTLGIALGITGAIALTRVLAAMLFGVSATDAATYVVACAVLAGAAMIASIVPARRALKVDAIAAIRGD
jgi:ABC-type antimicrobial peptide transport system permease subunit